MNFHSPGFPTSLAPARLTHGAAYATNAPTRFTNALPLASTHAPVWVSSAVTPTHGPVNVDSHPGSSSGANSKTNGKESNNAALLRALITVIVVLAILLAIATATAVVLAIKLRKARREGARTVAVAAVVEDREGQTGYRPTYVSSGATEKSMMYSSLHEGEETEVPLVAANGKEHGIWRDSRRSSLSSDESFSRMPRAHR